MYLLVVDEMWWYSKPYNYMNKCIRSVVTPLVTALTSGSASKTPLVTSQIGDTCWVSLNCGVTSGVTPNTTYY